jgi:hypothetical protein
MSSQNIWAGLNESHTKHLTNLLNGGDEAAVRDYLNKFDKADVDALLADHISTPKPKTSSSFSPKGKAPATPGPSTLPKVDTTGAPAGLADVASAFGTTPGSSFVEVPVVEADKHEAKVPDPQVEITEKEIHSMWKSIDEYDVTLLDPEVVEAFKYQGFDPSAVLKSLMRSKKANKITQKDFLNDINTLCALAIIKGSITDKNIQKMSDKGKSIYDALEKKYSITRGGGKGKPAEVVTVARIAAAFPGKVIQLLQCRKVPGRDFVGEFQTHKLPGVIKHQALAACIPQSLPDKSKQFLLDLVTAYSVDQTKTISKTKGDTNELLERQRQFTNVSHNGMFPPEEMRKQIIKQYNWNELFDSINPVAVHIKGKWTDFSQMTKDDFLADIKKI